MLILTQAKSLEATKASTAPPVFSSKGKLDPIHAHQVSILGCLLTDLSTTGFSSAKSGSKTCLNSLSRENLTHPGEGFLEAANGIQLSNFFAKLPRLTAAACALTCIAPPGLHLWKQQPKRQELHSKAQQVLGFFLRAMAQNGYNTTREYKLSCFEWMKYNP